jgi:hypothetical protein
VAFTRAQIRESSNVQVIRTGRTLVRHYPDVYPKSNTTPGEDEFDAWLGRARYERRPDYQRGEFTAAKRRHLCDWH